LSQERDLRWTACSLLVLDTDEDAGRGQDEAVGTFLLVLVGTAVVTAAILGKNTAGPAYDSLAIALSFGLVLVAIVAALGQVSGAHVNPAVTVDLAAAGKFPWRYVPAYLVAQVVGVAFTVWGAYGCEPRRHSRA